KPLPSVTWWRESVLLDDTYTVTPHGVVRNELEILSLKRHDLMAVFTCQASNNNFSQPALAAVTVDMNCKYSLYSMNEHLVPLRYKCPINSTGDYLRLDGGIVLFECRLVFIELWGLHSPF
ncbi:uncharacterized protein NPIL_328511, partial [Nephila pilipes]